MSPILVVETIQELRKKLTPLKLESRRIGLVPTMGALHQGHLSLARQSVESCDVSVATIFVNPTQFAPGEDLDKYPRTLAADVEMLASEGVEFVFAPQRSEIYPDGCSTFVNPPEVATVLEGEFRPTHFQGVCTIVLKLLNIANPDIAFFGQKDFQQLAVIRQMVKDLDLDIEIVGCPIVRESDGLAMSSRNRYLDDEQRKTSLVLSRAIRYGEEQILGGETDAHCLMAELRQILIDGGVTSIDYAVVCDPETLQVMNEIRRPAVVLLAAFVGETRLIDNVVVK